MQSSAAARWVVIRGTRATIRASASFVIVFGVAFAIGLVLPPGDARMGVVPAAVLAWGVWCWASIRRRARFLYGPAVVLRISERAITIEDGGVVTTTSSCACRRLEQAERVRSEAVGQFVGRPDLERPGHRR